MEHDNIEKLKLAVEKAIDYTTEAITLETDEIETTVEIITAYKGYIITTNLKIKAEISSPF